MAPNVLVDLQIPHLHLHPHMCLQGTPPQSWSSSTTLSAIITQYARSYTTITSPFTLFAIRPISTTGSACAKLRSSTPFSRMPTLPPHGCNHTFPHRHKPAASQRFIPSPSHTIHQHRFIPRVHRQSCRLAAPTSAPHRPGSRPITPPAQSFYAPFRSARSLLLFRRCMSLTVSGRCSPTLLRGWVSSSSSSSRRLAWIRRRCVMELERDDQRWSSDCYIANDC